MTTGNGRGKLNQDAEDVLLQVVSAKTEANARHSSEIDSDVAKMRREMNAIKLSVQSIKETLDEFRGPINQIPAIKSLLIEILGKLP